MSLGISESCDECLGQKHAGRALPALWLEEPCAAESCEQAEPVILTTAGASSSQAGAGSCLSIQKKL